MSKRTHVGTREQKIDDLRLGSPVRPKIFYPTRGTYVVARAYRYERAYILFPLST